MTSQPSDVSPTEFLNKKSLLNKTFSDWQERESLAEQSLPLIGALYRNFGVVIVIYNRPLIHRPPEDILKAHLYVRQVEGEELSIRDSFPLLEAMSKMALTPARIDIGKLAILLTRSGKKESAEAFLQHELSACVGGNASLLSAPQDVVLYGFGRIGRLVARLLLERTGNGDGLRLRAMVVRKGRENDLEKRAELLRRDSVHGRFSGVIDVDKESNSIIANGTVIKVIYASSPDQVDYEAHGIRNAIICDNTGIWRDSEGLGLHLKSKGAGKVLLTAPGKGDIKNIVFGVNHAQMEDETMLSAASCTTNAITPVLKALHERFGIAHGHIESVHSFTNDQNLIDNYHKSDRRGRSAALNMVLTSTGAAKAVAKALPELKGRLTGNAIRVPTPNVSMAILVLSLRDEVNVDLVNEHLRQASLHSVLQKQIGFSASSEIASTDMVGSRHAGVIDSKATIAEGNRCIIYVWYDNEFGYSVQVLRMLQLMANLTPPTFPALG